MFGQLYGIATVVLFFGIVARRYGDSLYCRLGIVALVFHLVVGLIVIPQLPYGWDIWQFHEAAVHMLDGGLVDDEPDQVAAFATVQAVLYVVYVPDVRIVSIINALLAVLVPIPACYLARMLYPTAVESTDGLLAVLLFLPVPVLLLTNPMRDALSLLVCFSLVALLVRGYVEGSSSSVLVAIPLFGVLYFLRPELALVVLIGLCGSGIAHVVVDEFEWNLSLAGLGTLLLPVGAIGVWTFTWYFSFERLEAERSARAVGGAAYLEEFAYTSWAAVVHQAPLRALYFQFAPFPLHVESLFHLLPVVFSLPVIVLFVICAYRSILYCRTNEVVLAFLLTVYVGGIVGYGLVDSNFGTTVRHRIPFEFLLAVFAAPVIERWERSLSDRLRVRPEHGNQNDEQDDETHEPNARV